MFSTWLDDLIELFNTDYGTTSFFSNPYAAQEWVDSNIILSNPRLSDAGNPSQRQILIMNSNESLDYALQVTNDPVEAAAIYWDLMRDYILLNTYDERLANVFNQGAQAAEDTASLTFDEDVKSQVKIPWWLLAFPLAFLFFRR
jgi:hypothetical protein